MNTKTLDQLKPGQSGTVVQLTGHTAVRRRMLDMGLVTGTEVRVLRLAPLGDPIEFQVRGYSLSLRRAEAKEVRVQLAGEADSPEEVAL